MNILWIEDDPQGDQRDRILFQESGFFTDSINRLDIPHNFDDCYDAIGRAISEYDLIVFDLNLKDFSETELVRKIAHEFGRKNTEFLEESGFYLYQMLVRQGFPDDRIVFLTGHASNGYRVKTYKDRLLDTEKPEHFKGIVAKIRELLSDPDNEAFDEVLKEYQTNGNIQRINEFLKEVIRKMKAGETNKDLYDRFEEKFQNSLTHLAPSIHKNDVANFHAWLDNRLTKRGAHFSYLTLRRGIIVGCRELKERLTSESEDWILFNRTGLRGNSPLSKDYIRDYLTKLETFFPLNPPTEPKSRANLHLQFIKELTAEWESSEGYFKDKNVDLFKCFCHQEMKLLRNWTAHGQMGDLDEKQVAFFFIVAMRAWFDLEPITVMEYERALASVFNKSDLCPDEVKSRLSRSYKDLYKTCKKNKIYWNGIFFNDLFRELGLHVDKTIAARASRKLFYQNFWHALYPARIGSITPDQSNAVNIQIIFRDDYRGVETIGHIANFLVCLILHESFP